MVNVATVVPVGVPVIAPVPEFNVAHAGNAPLVTPYEYGVVPPLAVVVLLYAVPTVGVLSAASVSTGHTRKLKFADPPHAPDVALSVIAYDPTGVVAVVLSTPVLLLTVIPVANPVALHDGLAMPDTIGAVTWV
jgi:hypothetical protein